MRPRSRKTLSARNWAPATNTWWGLREGATLTVTQNANAVNLPPISQELPPLYLPEALGHLLPRLLPVKEAKGYAFASFIGEQRAVMMRYIDVGSAEQVEPRRARYHVIPVSDRLGFDGPATVHYLGADAGAEGKRRYLGSVNDQQHVMVLATDSATLQKIWSNPNLNRPAGVQTPTPQASNENSPRLDPADSGAALGLPAV